MKRAVLATVQAVLGSKRLTRHSPNTTSRRPSSKPKIELLREALDTAAVARAFDKGPLDTRPASTSP